MLNKTQLTGIIIGLVLGASISFTYFNSIISEKNLELTKLDESIISFEELVYSKDKQITSLESEICNLESTLKLRDIEIEAIASAIESTQVNKRARN